MDGVESPLDSIRRDVRCSLQQLSGTGFVTTSNVAGAVAENAVEEAFCSAVMHSLDDIERQEVLTRSSDGEMMCTVCFTPNASVVAESKVQDIGVEPGKGSSGNSFVSAEAPIEGNPNHTSDVYLDIDGDLSAGLVPEHDSEQHDAVLTDVAATLKSFQDLMAEQSDVNIMVGQVQLGVENFQANELRSREKNEQRFDEIEFRLHKLEHGITLQQTLSSKTADTLVDRREWQAVVDCFQRDFEKFSQREEMRRCEFVTQALQMGLEDVRRDFAKFAQIQERALAHMKQEFDDFVSQTDSKRCESLQKQVHPDDVDDINNCDNSECLKGSICCDPGTKMHDNALREQGCGQMGKFADCAEIARLLEESKEQEDVRRREHLEEIKDRLNSMSQSLSLCKEQGESRFGDIAALLERRFSDVNRRLEDSQIQEEISRNTHFEKQNMRFQEFKKDLEICKERMELSIIAQFKGIETRLEGIPNGAQSPVHMKEVENLVDSRVQASSKELFRVLTEQIQIVKVEGNEPVLAVQAHAREAADPSGEKKRDEVVAANFGDLPKQSRVTPGTNLHWSDPSKTRIPDALDLLDFRDEILHRLGENERSLTLFAEALEKVVGKTDGEADTTAKQSAETGSIENSTDLRMGLVGSRLADALSKMLDFRLNDTNLSRHIDGTNSAEVPPYSDQRRSGIIAHESESKQPAGIVADCEIEEQKNVELKADTPADAADEHEPIHPENLGINKEMLVNELDKFRVELNISHRDIVGQLAEALGTGVHGLRRLLADLSEIDGASGRSEITKQSPQQRILQPSTGNSGMLKPSGRAPEAEPTILEWARQDYPWMHANQERPTSWDHPNVYVDRVSYSFPASNALGWRADLKSKNQWASRPATASTARATPKPPSVRRPLSSGPSRKHYPGSVYRNDHLLRSEALVSGP